MVLWLSTDFGDFPNFWWGVPLKSGVSQKRFRNLQLTIYLGLMGGVRLELGDVRVVMAKNYI